MNELKRVGILGEAMGELFTESQHRMIVGTGGDTFNAAVYLAQSESCAQPHFFSAIGTDPFSQLLLERCAEFDVQATSIEIDPVRSIGLYSISNDNRGERHFNYWRSDSAARHYLHHLDATGAMQALLNCDAIFFSGITLAVMQPDIRHSFLQALRTYKKGAIYFDDNYRPLLWGENAEQWYKEVYQASDYLLLSVEDQLNIHGLSSKEELISMLQDYPEKTIVLRNGDQPMTIMQQHQQFDLDVDPVKPIDTTAAGDSFTGTFIALTETGVSTEQAATFAAKVSAHVIQQAGALVQLPMTLRRCDQ
jgi:2-dehydro-3-deoxygluconokinase